MVIRLEGEPYRVLEASAHSGTAKLPGFVHARLVSLRTGSETTRRFRLDERVEDVPVVRRVLEFLYRAGDELYFMDPESFDQIPVSRDLLGPAHRYLREGLRVPVEFLEDRPVAVLFPETVELRVTSTAAPMHATQTSAMKRAVLENGLEVAVPLFIREGELIRVEVATGKYVERVRESRR